MNLESFVFQILENQAKLFQYLGQYSWQIDLNVGALIFRPLGGEKILAEVPIQYFGHHHEEAKTWLWAWANQENTTPSNLLQGILQVREQAKRDKKGVFELAGRFHLPYENYDVELAILCAGYLEHFTYLGCPYEKGSLFVGLQECPEAKRVARDAVLVRRVIEVGVAKLKFDHSRALLAYLGKPLELPSESWRWNIGSQQLVAKINRDGSLQHLDVIARGK